MTTVHLLSTCNTPWHSHQCFADGSDWELQIWVMKQVQGKKINTKHSVLLGVSFCLLVFGFVFYISDLKITIYKFNHNLLFLSCKIWATSWRKWRRNKVEIPKEMSPTKETRGFTVNVLLDPHLHVGQNQTPLWLLLFPWFMKVTLYSLCVVSYHF